MLKLRQADYDDIRRHAEETYPNECCGMLLGTQAVDKREVRATVRCANGETGSPQNRYTIDPRELVRVQRQARERRLDIIGFYHSHPDREALWSPTDFDEAHWIGCSYVITSVEQGKATLTNSFVLMGTVEEDKALMKEQVVVE
jgi:proteasome lid subunit RPN8/RPN11